MGIRTKKEAVLNGLKPDDRSKIFKNFNESGSDVERYVMFIQSPESCGQRIEITLDAEYTTIASDTSDLKDVLNFVGSIVQQVGYPPTLAPRVIINGLHDASGALEAIIEKENITGEQVTLKFPLTVCDKPREVIMTTLRVHARGLVSNASEEGYDPNSPNSAFAKVDLTLNIGSDAMTEARVVSAFDAQRGSWWPYTIVNYSLVSGTQTVVAMVAPTCQVTSEFSFKNEIASYTISKIQLIIEVIPESYYARLPKRFITFLRDQGVDVPDSPDQD